MAKTAVPRDGQHIRLIRYTRSLDGWTHEIVQGRLEEHTDTLWRIRIVDDLRELPRNEWAPYSP